MICDLEQKHVLERHQARARIAHLRHEGREHGHRERLSAYYCVACDGWHIGHGNRRRRR